MLMRLLLFFLAWMPFMVSVDAGYWDKIPNSFWKSNPTVPPMIKVLVVHDEPGVIIEVKGKYKIFDPRTNEHISSRFVGKRKFIQPLKDGLRWGEEFPGVHQLIIMPDDQATTIIVDGIEYKGAIYVYDIGGAISVVNEINIEDYLKSLLARQYLESLSEETMAAIAIVARTNIYAQAINPKSPYWAVDGRKIGYQGHAIVSNNTGIDKAINATRYLIISKNSSGDIAPFLSTWKESKPDKTTEGQPASTKITLAEAEEMAKKGSHAAQILNKAFPDISIILMYSQTR